MRTLSKKEMIKELVKCWVKNAEDRKQWEVRYCQHDYVENKIDRSWLKEGIEWCYQQFKNGENIERIINRLYFR